MTSLELEAAPGHLIRRVAQVHKALWTTHVSSKLTSPQYAVLVALSRESGLDQRTLGERVSLDRSTTADVVARLGERKLLARVRDTRDGRRNLLSLSDDGRRVLARASKEVVVVRKMLLEPLSPTEGEQLITLLDKVLHHFDELDTTAAPD